MAEYGIDLAQAPPAAEERSSRQVAALTNWVGAVLSCALIAGLVVWGYRITVRDVSGVPIVQAIDGPMRVAPDDPGGNRAQNQGLAVNTVAGAGAASGPIDQVTLAPRPAGLAEEDVALGLLDTFASEEPLLLQPATPSAGALPQTGAGQSGQAGLEALVDRLVETPAPSGSNSFGGGQAVIDALGSVELPDPDFEPRAPSVWPGIQGTPPPVSATPSQNGFAAPPVAPLGPPGAGIATATEFAVARSLRPRARQGGSTLIEQASIPSSVTASGEDPIMAAIRESAALTGPLPAAVGSTVPEIDHATLPPGTRLVQIGAFDSAATARAQWDRLVPRFGAYLNDKARVIQRASSGGRVFYRLRAHGFVDLADARRFCAAFVAGGVDCIPVTTR